MKPISKNRAAKQKRTIRVDTIVYDEVENGSVIHAEVEDAIIEMETRKDSWEFLSAFTTIFFGKQRIHLIYSQPVKRKRLRIKAKVIKANTK